MLTDKSTDTFEKKGSNTVLLELNPKTLAPPFQKVFPKRIIKLHQNTSSKKARTLKLLQSLQLLQYGKNEPNYSVPENNSSDSKQKKSSYLIYRKQQQNLRANHHFKLLHLRSKCLQPKSGLKKVGESSTQRHLGSARPPQMKISNSKLNLIVIGLDEKQDNYCTSRAKSRQFYIKTSEGKKQKVNTTQYENKLRSKFNQTKEENKVLHQTSNQYSQSTFVTNFGQSRQSLKRQSCSVNRKRFNIKYKANSLTRFNNERSMEFRPWTSDKSDLGER